MRPTTVAHVQQYKLPDGYIAPELFSFRSDDGLLLYGCAVAPSASVLGGPVDLSQPQPTICYVYGGPQVQVTKKK